MCYKTCELYKDRKNYTFLLKLYIILNNSMAHTEMLQRKPVQRRSEQHQAEGDVIPIQGTWAWVLIRREEVLQELLSKPLTTKYPWELQKNIKTPKLVPMELRNRRPITKRMGKVPC